MPADTIRFDLFAVKTYAGLDDDDLKIRCWSLEGIYRSLESASEKRRELWNDHRRQFPLCKPIIYHPRQDIVDVYLLGENRIVD